MRKKVMLLLLFSLIFGGILTATERAEIFAEKGNEAYSGDRYEVALRFYNKAIEEGNEDAIIWYRLAYCVEQTVDLDEAWKHYWDAIVKLRDQNREHRYFGYAKGKILSN